MRLIIGFAGVYIMIYVCWINLKYDIWNLANEIKEKNNGKKEV